MIRFAGLRQWLFRVAVDHARPIVIDRRHLFIIPTGAGLLYALLLLVMLLGAINYDLSLGHALVFLLASLGLVAMIHTYRNLIALQIFARRAEPVFAGEIAHFPITLTNDRPYARRALDLGFRKQQSSTLSIAPHDRVTVAIACRAERRGRLQTGRLTLATRYPLGLFRAWSYPYPPCQCVVYPRPHRSPFPTLIASSHQGELLGDHGQEDFSGLRQHQPNDSPRHIAWKAFARDSDNRPLLVKQFAGGASEERWFDFADAIASPNLEERLSILAGWIVAADESRLRYGLRLPGQQIELGEGPAQRAACLEALALYGHVD